MLNESRLVIAHLGVNPMQGSSRHVTSLAADQRFFGNLALAGGAQAGEIAIVLEIRQAESGAVLARRAVTRQNGQPTQLQEFWELVPGELPANQSLELSVIAREGKQNQSLGRLPLNWFLLSHWKRIAIRRHQSSRPRGAMKPLLMGLMVMTAGVR